MPVVRPIAVIELTAPDDGIFKAKVGFISVFDLFDRVAILILVRLRCLWIDATHQRALEGKVFIGTDDYP